MKLKNMRIPPLAIALSLGFISIVTPQEKSAKKDFMEQQKGRDGQLVAFNQKYASEKKIESTVRDLKHVFSNQKIGPRRLDMMTILLAMHGFDSKRIELLGKRGVDVVSSVVAPKEIWDEAVESPLIVLGTIEAILPEDLGDDYRSTVVIKSLELLKGKLSQDRIRIRQFSGPLPNGKMLIQSHELGAKDVGRTFLFFLSSQLYEYAVEWSKSQGKKTLSRIDKEIFYRPLYSPKILDGSRFIYELNTARSDSATVLGEIRKLSKILTLN